MQATVVTVIHRRMTKVLTSTFASFLVVLLTTGAGFNDEPFFAIKAKTTFDKYLIEAERGDAKIQNFLGYMLFFGEGTEQDFDEAHMWFHLAAEAGELAAKRNLGLLHARAVPGIPERFLDAQESNFWLSQALKDDIAKKLYTAESFDAQQVQQYSNEVAAVDYFLTGTPLELGEKVYQTFCAGCHGMNGKATFSAAPSFIDGERLHKTDAQLLASIVNGNGLMPAWKKTLSKELSENVLLYLRNGFEQSNDSASLADATVNSTNEPVNTNMLGTQTYSKYCAGCHGFNGIAYYVNSPSFALGQSMSKSDAKLKQSIENGFNMMPDWGNKISQQEIDAVVKYIRTLSNDFNAGIDRELKNPLSHFYRFRVKETWLRTKPIQ